jgi:hypothetical protein
MSGEFELATLTENAEQKRPKDEKKPNIPRGKLKPGAITHQVHRVVKYCIP